MNYPALRFLLVGLCGAVVARAAVKPHPLFADNLVLQQGVPVAVFGRADAGEAVTVSFRGQRKETKAGADGAWLVRLDAMKAEENQQGSELTIAGATGAPVVAKDVLVGEVWLGSGQSNMLMLPVQSYPPVKQAVDAADLPNVRLMAVQPVKGDPSAIDYKGWRVCSPATAKGFPATGLFFATSLHRAIRVPVGIVVSAQGGTALAPWVPMAALEADAELGKLAVSARDEVLAARAKSGGQIETEDPNAGRSGSGTVRVAKIAPGELHARYIAPLVPFTFRGVIWDQGESGVGMNAGYTPVYRLLLKSWREAWGAELPFVFIQMPKGGGWNPRLATKDGAAVALATPPATVPDGKPHRMNNEFLEDMTKLPGNYIAASFDLARDIHPWDKDRYGERFALTALREVYGRAEVACYGATFKSAKRAANGEVRVELEHAEGGMKAVGAAEMQGFVLAGADNVWHWAHAKAEGSAVVLASEAVKEPKKVGYAHAYPTPWANVFNGADLPLQPFVRPVP